jgi:hypothetical protein
MVDRPPKIKYKTYKYCFSKFKLLEIKRKRKGVIKKCPNIIRDVTEKSEEYTELLKK